MHTEQKQCTVAELCDGFVYNELEEKGLWGLLGRLTITPKYQRNYLYAEDNGKKEVAEIIVRPNGLRHRKESKKMIDIKAPEHRARIYSKMFCDRFEGNVRAITYILASYTPSGNIRIPFICANTRNYLVVNGKNHSAENK